MTAVTIVSVYPEILGTYGDAGNVSVLERRLSWRGIAARVLRVPVGRPLPKSAELYVLGGSEDDNQHRALLSLRESPLAAAVEAGAHVFGVCAGMQLLGTSLNDRDGHVVDGMGLIDVSTRRLQRRVVGEVVASLVNADLPVLTGFANHGGGTAIGPSAKPLAMTTYGRGNQGGQGDPEGAIQGNVVTTYLHGPVLARNPAFADWLLARVTGTELAPLPEGPPEALHEALSRPHLGRRLHPRG
jgi:CobQ-like glutamine amidotransferase family enzyme